MFGYNIHKHNFTIQELPFQFNHMSMFSEEWNGSADPFESFIIHFAGRNNRTDAEIKEVRDKIYGNQYN